jgi:hypothetical protein
MPRLTSTTLPTVKGKIRLLVAESGKVAVFKPTLFLRADWSLLTRDPSDLKASTGPSFSPLVFPLLSHVLPFKIPLFRIWKTGASRVRVVASSYK